MATAGDSQTRTLEKGEKSPVIEMRIAKGNEGSDMDIAGFSAGAIET